MRAFVLVLVVGGAGFAEDIGPPVPLPREGSPTFDREAVAKLAEIDARLARAEVLVADLKAAAKESLVSDPAPLYTPQTRVQAYRVCDGNQCYTVPATGSGTAVYYQYAGPVLVRSGIGSGWYPGRFLGRFFGGCR